MNSLPDISLRQQQEALMRAVFLDDCEVAAQTIKVTGFAPEQRLQIYRNNTFIGFREALAGVYSVVAKLVGEEFFQHVARQFINVSPSSSGNLHDFGEGFARFLQSFPGMETVPYVADVAAMEWAYHRVFHSPQGKAINLQKLSQVFSLAEITHSLSDLKFQVNASVQAVASSYPILRIWQSNQDGYVGDPVCLDEDGDCLLVARCGPEVMFHSVGQGCYAMLMALREGKSFVVACDVALRSEPDCDVSYALQYLVRNQMISDFSLPASKENTVIDKG